MAEKKDKPQVFDVSKPGKSLPNATSRPVITGHGPMLKDPMVSDKDEDKSDDKAEKVEVKTSSPNKVIAPPEGAEKLEEKEETKPENSDAKDQSEDTPAEDDKRDSPAELENKKPIETDTVDGVTEQAAKPQKGELSPEELEKQQQYDKLVTEQTYFVPIGEVTRRRNNRRAFAILAIFLLIIIIGGYLAVDAEFIETDIKLPLELFKD